MCVCHYHRIQRDAGTLNARTYGKPRTCAHFLKGELMTTYSNQLANEL